MAAAIKVAAVTTAIKTKKPTDNLGRALGGASDEELLDVVGKAVGNKKAKHAGMSDLQNMENRSMIKIGG